MVDSQGYEDVEKIRQIALKALSLVGKPEAVKDEEGMANSKDQDKLDSLKVSHDTDMDSYSIQLRGQQLDSETKALPKAPSRMKQKRTSIERKSTPKLPPKSVPKLPPKVETQVSSTNGVGFRLSQEVPVTVETTSVSHYHGDRKTSGPRPLPRNNSTTAIDDHPPEIPRRRAKTDLGFKENPKLSKELGLIRERDSSGYLIPTDQTADDFSTAPPPPLPPKGATFAVENPISPPLPVKRRSSRISELDIEAPPLLPRKNADKNVPNMLVILFFFIWKCKINYCNCYITIKTVIVLSVHVVEKPGPAKFFWSFIY